MNSRIPYLVSCLALVALVACRNKTATPEQTPTAPSPANSTPTVTSAAAAPYDLQFLDTMAKHHTAAIQMAGMAEAKVKYPELKKLVATIRSDQQKEVDQIRSWRDQWYPGAASAENMQMPGTGAMNMDISQVQSTKAGPGYDVMFIDMMVPHHESAVAMSRDALEKAEHQDIKTLAQQIIDEQTREIDHMKKWKKALAKDTGRQ